MKRALCVGINEYCNFPGSNLRGCRNDCLDMAAFFQIELGFNPAQVFYLLDRKATKQAVVDSLMRLVAQTAPGDYLAFSHSSHGTQVPDKNGDEFDGYDEALVCHDLAETGGDWDRDTIITDDELMTIFGRLPQGAVLEVWLDTCHSGRGLRHLGLSYDRARFLPHPGGLLDLPPRGKMLGFNPFPRSVLWAGCEEDGTSADTYRNNKWCGAFTSAFLQEYREGLSRGDLLKRVRGVMTAAGYAQVPQLECLKKLADLRVGT